MQGNTDRSLRGTSTRLAWFAEVGLEVSQTMALKMAVGSVRDDLETRQNGDGG